MLLNHSTAIWRPAHSTQIKEFLGVRGKLPDEGMAPREVQGVTLFVLPLQSTAKRSGYSARRMGHRVQAICPNCGKVMSAGRLNQHYALVH